MLQFSKLHTTFPTTTKKHWNHFLTVSMFIIFYIISYIIYNNIYLLLKRWLVFTKTVGGKRPNAVKICFTRHRTQQLSFPIRT